MVKTLPCKARGTSSIPWSGKIPRAAGQTRPVHHSSPEPARPGADAPQREEPLRRETWNLQSSPRPLQLGEGHRQPRKGKGTHTHDGVTAAQTLTQHCEPTAIKLLEKA